jgi:cytoskeleton protein RodZ
MSEMAVNERSAGALLRAARERQGLHIAALAAAIKVAPRKLEALEGDRLSELPDATFARALAQTVCRTLKIDAQPVLALLPPAGGVGFQSAGAGLNAPYREKPGRDKPPFALAAVRPMVWAGGLLMLAAVVLYFLPTSLWTRVKLPGLSVPSDAPASAEATTTATPTSSVVLPNTPNVPTAAAALGATPAANAVPPVSGAVTSAANPATNAATNAASGVTGETVFSTPQQAQGDATPPAGAVQLRVTEASWMDVRDAKGQVLLSRMVQPGESVGLDGAPPIRLTIGNAAATQLGYKGQAINIAPFSSGNVARLELR